ncbi:MAG: phosphoribosyltransferase [Burkholderiales bacterium]|jgi:putative phosphoribosyl transferase|nr:phosphoribosyltransferase [Burkholderiales bacterium]
MRADTTPHYFADRHDAGERLAALLAQHPPHRDTVILALPRGGVPVGVAVARRFGLPLEPLLVRKLGVPHFPEFAMGAIASGGICVVDQQVVSELKLPAEAIDQVILTERRVLAEREHRYGPSVPLSRLKQRPLIVCDDGMATGRSMQAAIAALRAAKAGAITVAVPVLSREALERITPLVQQVRYLLCPPLFDAVGQWYRNFPQLGDNEVISLLSQVQRLSAQSSVSHKAST